MNNVMTNSFCELNENEMMMVDGGWDGWMFLGGAGATVLGAVGFAAACASFNVPFAELSAFVMVGGMEMCRASFYN